MQEQEYEAYYLRDFVYFALKGWRKIFVFALIGAILMTAVALFRSQGAEGTEIDKGTEEIALSDDEIAAVHDKVVTSDLTVIRYNQRINFLQENISVLSERLSNSVYLSLDADAQPLGTFVLEVTMNNVTDENEDILLQRHLLLSLDYLRLIRSTSFYNYLEKNSIATISGSNLRELVEVNLQPNDNIIFKFTGPDMNYIRQLIDSAQEYIFFEAENQTSYSYPHTLTIRDIDFKTIKNPSIQRDRENAERELKNLDDELEILQLELKDIVEEIENTEVEAALKVALEEKILAEEEQKEREQAEDEKTDSVSGTVNLPLYMIGGLIVGALVAILWNFYRGASSGKLLHPDDFSRRIGLLYINQVFVREEAKDSKNKRFGSSVDRWLERRYLAPKLRAADSMEDSINYVSSVIRGICESRNKKDSNKAYKIVALAEDVPVIQRLTDAINDKEEFEKEKAFELISLDGNATQIAMIDSLRAADAALFFVQPRKTKIQHLLRSLEITQELNKPVLGLISVEEIV